MTTGLSKAKTAAAANVYVSMILREAKEWAENAPTDALAKELECEDFSSEEIEQARKEIMDKLFEMALGLWT